MQYFIKQQQQQQQQQQQSMDGTSGSGDSGGPKDDKQAIKEELRLPPGYG